MPQFVKKPIEIEARQVTRETGPDLALWCKGTWASLYGRGDRGEDLSNVSITTLEGVMRADLGDWIIRGVKGEFYPCKPDIFAASYDSVDGEAVVEPDAGTLLAMATPDEIEQTAQQLKIMAVRDPRNGPVYAELATSLQGIAERRRRA